MRSFIEYVAESLDKRPDLKVIVTPAILDAEKFSKYFEIYSAPIFTIPGNMYPAETLDTMEPETNYMDAAALITVMQMNHHLFFIGQEEIGIAGEILFDLMNAPRRNVPELIVLPICSGLVSSCAWTCLTSCSVVFFPPSRSRSLLTRSHSAIFIV